MKILDGEIESGWSYNIGDYIKTTSNCKDVEHLLQNRIVNYVFVY